MNGGGQVMKEVVHQIPSRALSHAKKIKRECNEK